MAAVRRRPLAREDILDLWAYIAANNLRAADIFVDRLDEAFLLLARNPKIGRAMPDIGRGVRSFVAERYLIFYRVLPGGIDVGRVMHGSRDIAPEDILQSLGIPDEGANLRRHAACTAPFRRSSFTG